MLGDGHKMPNDFVEDSLKNVPLICKLMVKNIFF